MKTLDRQLGPLGLRGIVRTLALDEGSGSNLVCNLEAERRMFETAASPQGRNDAPRSVESTRRLMPIVKGPSQVAERSP